MMVDTLLEDGIGTVTLRHPPLNILTRAVLAELRESLARLAAEPELRALVLAAEGRQFSAGADVGEHLEPHHRELIPEFVQTVRALAEFPLPVVAAVKGKCLGGGFELVQAADVIVAGDSASFGQPEIRLGVYAPAACALLPGRCDPGVAAELVFTGDAIDAVGAREAGIVQHVVADDRVEIKAHELAGRIARHSAAALRVCKQALRAGTAAPTRAALHEAERLYVDELMGTADAGEGLRAFLDKRQPVWTHR
jgi:cyclohexa-1,5-dienecarbonyl-CoA hydratase